jgi:hypothetical protein
VDLINKERGGAMVDKALIRSCIEVYEKMGMGTLDAYVADFEAQLLAATRCVYVSRVADRVSGGCLLVFGNPACMREGVSPTLMACFAANNCLKRFLTFPASLCACLGCSQDVLRGQGGELDRGGQRPDVHDPRGEGPGGGAPARRGLPERGDRTQVAAGALVDIGGVTFVWWCGVVGVPSLCVKWGIVGGAGLAVWSSIVPA